MAACSTLNKLTSDVKPECSIMVSAEQKFDAVLLEELMEFKTTGYQNYQVLPFFLQQCGFVVWPQFVPFRPPSGSFWGPINSCCMIGDDNVEDEDIFFNLLYEEIEQREARNMPPRCSTPFDEVEYRMVDNHHRAHEQ